VLAAAAEEAVHRESVAFDAFHANLIEREPSRTPQQALTAVCGQVREVREDDNPSLRITNICVTG
jgi:hypothetical protein